MRAEDSGGDETIQDICDALRRHGDEALEGRPVEEVAREWFDAGFDDAEEVDEWLHSRCFDAGGAQSLERAGITPAQAALRTTEGASPYEETIGYKVVRGDLSHEEARRIITNFFWNT